MAEITTDDINIVLSTVVKLFPGENKEANEQKLTVSAMALAALCQSFEVDKNVLIERVLACYDEMEKIPTRPMIGGNPLNS